MHYNNRQHFLPRRCLLRFPVLLVMLRHCGVVAGWIQLGLSNFCLVPEPAARERWCCAFAAPAPPNNS